MGKIKSGGSSADSGKRYNEKELVFVNRIYDRCNRYSDADVDNQVLAMKSIIEYIKYRKNAGASLEDIKEEVLKYVYNLIVQINNPNLANFYRLRTYEYIDGMNLIPYINTIIEKNINVMEFAKKYENDLSANLDMNIVIELCGLMTDFVEQIQYSYNDEILYLREKIVNNDLGYEDVELLNKWILKYCEELKIGRAASWEKARKNMEEIRELFYKKLDSIFEVKKIVLKDKGSKEELASEGSIDGSIDEENRKKVASIIGNQSESSYSIVDSINENGNVHQYEETVRLRPFKGNPFISTDEKNNFMIYIHEIFQRISTIGDQARVDRICAGVYDLVKLSENEPIGYIRDSYKRKVYDFFDASLSYTRNSLYVKEDLMKRIAVLVDFFRANGDLDRFCETNNSRLKTVKLPEIQIDTQTLYDKFVADKEDPQDLIYMRDGEAAWFYYNKCYKNTPLSLASSEAITAMSSFYMNRLAKEAPHFGRLRYILDQDNLIEHIYENPDVTFEELGLDSKQLRLYMAMSDELQNVICKKYVDELPEGSNFNEEKWVKDVIKMLRPRLKNVYENYFKKQGFNFDFEEDVKNIIYNTVVPDYIYDLKTFSAKSLIYTAITDKKKNILNWGYVLEDENEDSNMALIGFDIKTLNMPVFVHLKKDDLIQFLQNVQNNAVIPVYEGADDMYNYILKKRFSTQILYPISKDERATLKKVKGAITDDRLYQHLRWLYSPTKGGVTPFIPKHMPGDRAYDLETGKIIKLEVEEKKPSDDSKPNKKQNGKNNKKNKKKQNPKQGGPGSQGAHGSDGNR
ncbi:MAG: hypothetical protein IKE01_01730 [Clostridia bacterium]|nr:hypothetical protein [Clostridia bacterium]